MKREDKYESIKSKLRKLLALADRGVNGEAENAKKAIERICKEYGINIEDFFDTNKIDQYVFKVGQGKDMMNLFARCVSYVCGDIKDMTYRRISRSSIELELTSMQYAEIFSLFNWHKGNYEREMRDFKINFMSAYVGKHDLYLPKERDIDRDIEDMTIEELQRLLKVFKLKNAMSNNTYRKQLENK